MNEERKLEISKSALISLKAELLRKQGEVSNAKQDAKKRIENFKPTSKFGKESDTQTKEVDKSKETVKDAEDCEALRKSREALEKKSIIYEHLAQSSSVDERSEQYLVQFDKKQKENIDKEDYQESPKNYSSDSDEEWVDYVDCFGRTRRCHKTDVEHMKRQDERLKTSIGLPKHEDNIPNKTWIKEGEAVELQSPDAYKEQLRKQWEQKELELLTKDNIHYEDVLFNESRAHGVGYYALSGDAAERAKQQAELAAVRTQTEKIQSSVAEARKKREEALQARVKAARARQRVRAGLPPEEEEPKPSVTAMLLDFVEEQKKVSAKQAAEEARRKREEREEEAKKEREKIVREWDLGKEDLQAKMPFVQMTQEQWVEKKRLERIGEFAPVEELNTSKKKGKDSKEFDSKGFFLDTQGSCSSEYNQSMSDRPSTSQGREKKQYYDPSVNKSNTSFKSVLISNECDDAEEEPSIVTEESQRKGIEIAPPSTYEYYGPAEKKYKPNDSTRTNVIEAFAQGLKYLEEKKSKGKSKYDDMEP